MMARTRFDASRRLALPVVVASIGIAFSFAIYTSFRTAETSDSSERLADAGRELDRVSEDLQSIAIEQVLAVQGLYESSTIVTQEEFDHFVDIIGGGPADNQLAYAHRVTSDGLDEFLTLTRRAQPNFTLHDQGLLQSSDVYWPLLYSSQITDVGYQAGFDFGSDPTVRQAIETAFDQDRPVASSFVEVPGDGSSGDFAIVAPIEQGDEPIGVAVVTLRLDDLLTDRVHDLLGETAQLRMSDVTGSAISSDQQTANRWVDTVQVVGEQVRLVLEVSDIPAPSGSARWLLVLGIGMSLLAGGLIHDGSRRHSITRQLTALQTTLAEKDRFLASVSHELRTPLTTVVGIVEILASRIDDFGEENRELIQDVRASAQDLETLVDDHLTSARLTAGALTVNQELVDLDILVARALAGTERPDRLSMTIGKLGTCTGDAIRVRQIVRNLIRNAYRFAVSSIEIRTKGTGDRNVLEILNDGDPVADDVLEVLFEPFATGKRPGQPEAIGLGLSVSRKLARRMGGDLTYTYDGKRVNFSVSLPSALIAPKSDATTGLNEKLVAQTLSPT